MDTTKALDFALPALAVLEAIITAKASKGNYVGQTGMELIKARDEQRRYSDQLKEKAVERAAQESERKADRDFREKSFKLQEGEAKRRAGLEDAEFMAKEDAVHRALVKSDKLKALAKGEPQGFDEKTNTVTMGKRGLLPDLSPEDKFKLEANPEKFAFEKNPLADFMAKWDHQVANPKPVTFKTPEMIAAESAARESGKLAGKTTPVDIDAAREQATRGISLIDKMIGSQDGKIKPHPGFTSAVGRKGAGSLFGLMDKPVAGSPSASFMALHDQVTGQAFMEAFQSLKGAGQITEKEGAKAQSAITRMSAAQSEPEYMEAAREFQGVMRNALARKEAKATAGSALGALLPPPEKPKPSTLDAAIEKSVQDLPEGPKVGDTKINNAGMKVRWNGSRWELAQ